MTRLRLLAAEQIRTALPMAAAVAAMRRAFAALSSGRVVAPPRGVIDLPESDATVLSMAACLPGEALTGKTVAIFHRNPESGLPAVQGLLLVLDPKTGTPRALLDGGALTAWRTGAAGGAATDLLARHDAAIAALIGCGAQAETQLLALQGLRPWTEVRVCGRSEASARDFARRLRPAVDLPLRPVAAPEAAVDGAEVVVAATDSKEPLFDARRLAAGAHLTSVGSFTPAMREIDPGLARRARVFVDHRPAAAAEAGELIAAIAAGYTTEDAWTELGEVIAGKAQGRRSEPEITWFKSVGHAVQDAVAGALVASAAEAAGLGQVVTF